MSPPAPRSIDEFLEQLRTALHGEDPALIQDALYDAEEYLRVEVAANAGKPEADMLELVASTYGTPDEVATAYRDTEVRVQAALRSSVPRRAESTGWVQRIFSVFSDSRAYTSLFYMLLSLATGIIYFAFVTTGIALSLGLAVLIIGLPFFLTFIGMARVIALGEGRLLEAMTGERMPRRPVHPGPRLSLLNRTGAMLRDPRTWTTLVYFLLMLPIGVAYFVIATVGLAVGVSFIVAPAVEVLRRLGLFGSWGTYPINIEPAFLNNPFGFLVVMILGAVVLTLLMHVARGVGRIHVRFAKSLLVTRTRSTEKTKETTSVT